LPGAQTDQEGTDNLLEMAEMSAGARGKFINLLVENCGGAKRGRGFEEMRHAEPVQPRVPMPFAFIA